MRHIVQEAQPAYDSYATERKLQKEQANSKLNSGIIWCKKAIFMNRNILVHDRCLEIVKSFKKLTEKLLWDGKHGTEDP